MKAAAHLSLAREMARKIPRGPLSRDEATSAAALGIARAVAAWPGPGPVPEDYAAQAARLTIRMEVRSAIRWRDARRWHLGRGSHRGSLYSREPSPESAAEAAELRERLHVAIDRLPPRHAEAIRLRLEGPAPVEVDERIGRRPGPGRSPWARALSALRAELGIGPAPAAPRRRRKDAGMPRPTADGRRRGRPWADILRSLDAGETTRAAVLAEAGISARTLKRRLAEARGEPLTAAQRSAQARKAGLASAALRRPASG